MSKKIEAASIGAGDVEITLAGEKKVLRTTYKAAKMLSRQFGGFSDIVSQLMKVDLDVIEAVVSHGVGFTELGRKGLGEKIYETGPSTLIGPCIRYVGNLANGGKPQSADEDEDKDTEKNGEDS